MPNHQIALSLLLAAGLAVTGVACGRCRSPSRQRPSPPLADLLGKPVVQPHLSGGQPHRLSLEEFVIIRRFRIGWIVAGSDPPQQMLDDPLGSRPGQARRNH